MNTHDIELPPLPEPTWVDGEPYWYDRHMNAYARAAIEADRKCRGDPVASIYITESGEREFDDWRVPLPAGRTELFAAPQPAEPVKVPSDEQIDKAMSKVSMPFFPDKTGSETDRMIQRFVKELWSICYGSTTDEATKQQRKIE